VGPFKNRVGGSGNAPFHFAAWLERETKGQLKYELQVTTMKDWLWDTYWASKASQEHPFKLVYWSDQDITRGKWFAVGETIALLKYLQEEGFVRKRMKGPKIVFSLNVGLAM
jgi:hypothetical protein